MFGFSLPNVCFGFPDPLRDTVLHLFVMCPKASVFDEFDS